MPCKYLYLIIILLANTAAAQVRPPITISGKVLSNLFLLEDLRMTNASLGGDYEFSKNHSLGLHFYYLKNKSEQDTVDNISTRIFQNEQTFAYLATYNYYFQPFPVKRPQRFYLSLFYKLLRRTLVSDEAYKARLEFLIKSGQIIKLHLVF